MHRLIVNADDFGFTRGINQSIAELARTGAITSTTLMANALETPAAVTLAQKNNRLGVGGHLVLVDGTPVSDPKIIPSLLEPGTGCFYSTLGSFLRALFRGRIQQEHLVTEVVAQTRRLRGLGIHPTHYDTHKHTHMFPQVLEAILQAAKSEGVRAIRNPFEPSWSVACSPRAGGVRKLEVTTLARLYCRRFLHTVERSGIATTEGAIGVAATGSLDPATLANLLKKMPEGTWELVCHPGDMDEQLAAAQTRLKESRAVEAKALESLPSLLPSNTQMLNFGELRP